MACKELVELITDYCEGRLSPAEHARFEAHLALCDGCVAYLAQYRKTIALAGRLSEEEVREPAREQLLAVFRDWKASR